MSIHTKATGQSRLARVGLPPRGLSIEEAAAYIGVSVGTFDRMVKAGTMPAPKAIGTRLVWDLRQLDSAFDALPDTGGKQAVEPMDEWAGRV